MIKKLLSNIVFKLEDLQNEERNLVRFFSKIPRHADMRVLDVGCGYGRNIKLLGKLGYSVLGVEVNEAIVKSNNESNIKCLTVEEFDKTSGLYDVVLMSHVIEHFYPDQLLKFMEHYLARLKPGGFLIIATPLNSPYFYDDFDHIRPYSPVGINMVFGGNKAQVKYYGKNKIELLDIWFRRSPFRIVNFKGRFLGGQYHIQIINIICTILFRITFHIVGRCDGWMGLYKKSLDNRTEVFQ